MPSTEASEQHSNDGPSEEFLKMLLDRAAKRGLLGSERNDGEESVGGEEISVESVEVEGGGAIGENYGSSMIFANAKIRTLHGFKEMGVVVKTMKKTPWHIEIMNVVVLFEKEAEFFNKTVPAIKRFQDKRGVVRTITEIVPKCLYAKAENEGGIIITENICHQGFKMAERRRGLGLRHSILTLETLARFHAASLTMKILEPETFWDAFGNAQREASHTEERKTLFDRLYKQISKGKVLAMARAEAENGSPDSDLMLKMAEKGEEILRNRGQLGIDVLKSYREPLAVFNHGDFWVNNFMFRYETNTNGERIPTAVKILDFQMTRYGSPALDILTFLYTSTTWELRKAHEEDLLHAYHRALLEAICEAGLDPVLDFECDKGCVNTRGNNSTRYETEPPDGHPLSYSFFKEDLKRHGSWAFMIAEIMLRVVMADSSDAAGVIEATLLNETETEEEEDERITGYDMICQLTTVEYSKRMFQVFKELFHKGYLEITNMET